MHDHQEITDAGMIEWNDIDLLQPLVKPFRVIARYYSKSEKQANLLLCEWHNHKHQVCRNWYFEFTVDIDLQICFDLEYQSEQIPWWPYITYRRPLCDGIDIKRMKHGDVFGQIPEIPNILQLPFTDPITDLYQDMDLWF